MAANPTGYSSVVRLTLRQNGHEVSLSHSCDSFVIARNPIDLPAGPATVVTQIDDQRYERTVVLTVGMSSQRGKTLISKLPETANAV